MDGCTPFQPWTSAGAGSPRAQCDSAAKSAPAGSAVPEAESLDGPGVPGAMDGPRAERMQQIVENTLSGEARQQVSGLLGQISALPPAERLLLFLKLPTGGAGPQPDPLKQPLNPLGSRSEIQQTVMWIQTHLEVDPEISLPKQDVYEEYLEYCTSTKMKPLSTADFGKVMKQVYPGVKPRRLGTRGNSRYCYAGMRKRIKLEVPQLPDLGERQRTVEIPAVQNDLLIAASQLIREWAEKLLGLKFGNLCELARHLVDKSCVDGGSGAALLLADTLAESGEGDCCPHQRGVIKELKRKIQAQPSLSPGKVRPGKRSHQDLEREHEEEMEVHIKSEHYPPPVPLPTHYPTYYPPPPPPPLSHYQPPPPPPPNQPINLSAQRGYLPVPPPPRRLPLPGKKMILETYNNELNAPRDYSPQARVPPPPPAPLSPGTNQYLPKKMRATESFGGKGINRFMAEAEPPKREPEPPQQLYSSLPSYGDQNQGPPPDSNLMTEALREDIYPPTQNYFPHASTLPLRPDLPTEPEPPRKEPATVKKNKKMCLPPVLNDNGQPVIPRPAQRGRPRKKSLSKAKYTRRRPPAAPPGPPPPTPGPSGPPGPLQCSHDSCSSLTDNINRSGIICAEHHSQILNRERVISICSLDKHALDDYLNEGNSQEHEEELIKYLPQNLDSPLNYGNLKDNLQGDRGTEDKKPSNESAGQDYTHIGSAAAQLHPALPPQGDFLDPNNTGEDKDSVSKMREYLQKNLRVPSCAGYNGEDEGGPAGPLLVPTSGEEEERGSPQRFSFVPISPTASPFVSPRSTPQQGRRRRNPQLQLRRDTGPFAVPSANCSQRSFPMSAPPSPTILATKYRPSFVEQPPSGGGVLRSFLRDATPNYFGADRCPPLSADPLSREVSQFFPESGRSQSVPLADGAPYFGPPNLLLPTAPFASYNNTPCGSVPPTPTPGDFCDFGSFNETCDSISKSELDTENFHKICNELSFDGMTVESEVTAAQRGEEMLLSAAVMDNLGLDLLGGGEGARSVPGTPAPRRPAPLCLREGEGSRSVPCTPEERACFSYSNRDFLINGNSLERGALGGSPLPLAFSEDCPLSEQGGLPESDLLADLRNADFYDM